MEITVENLSKSFEGLPALHDVQLNVRSGELLALLGPSGSGKTTLLRVIAGLEAATGGRVLFGQDDAGRLPVQERGVGFVFQHYALFRHMNVADNISYGLRVRPRERRPSRAEIATRVRDLLRLVQLDGLERRYPGQLSGGQRQRVALARALAVEPRVLLLDEPFGALDAKVRRDLRRWLREIHERTGVTTIFVTHDQDEALELADRVAILREGRIEQIGTPDEIYENPASAFVMGFVGETSRIAVDVRDGAILRHDRTLPVWGPLPEPGPYQLHVRPYELSPAAPGAGHLSGTVVTLRRTGAGRQAEVRLGDTPEIVEVQLPEGAQVERGALIELALRGGRLFARL